MIVPKTFFYVYVSSAIKPFSNAEMQALLVKARNFNASQGISGLLLAQDGNFMQLLEGPEGAVRDLVSKIFKDPHHTGIITLLDQYVDEPQFSDWKMGFRDLTTPKSQHPPGYSDFLNTPLNSKIFITDPSQAQSLMLTFKKNQP